MTLLPSPIGPPSVTVQGQTATQTGPRTARDAALHKAARSLESDFLAQMLSYAGTNKVSDDFGGGIGEQQFASFLQQAEAEAMVRHGGIGLAEKLFESLKEHQNDPDPSATAARP